MFTEKKMLKIKSIVKALDILLRSESKIEKKNLKKIFIFTIMMIFILNTINYHQYFNTLKYSIIFK